MQLSELLISEEYQIGISCIWAFVASYENIAARDVCNKKNRGMKVCICFLNLVIFTSQT